MTVAQTAQGATGEQEPAPRWTGTEILTLAVCMLINMVDGLDYQLLPLSLVAIGSDIGAQPAAFAAAISAGFAGAALGTPIGGWMGDARGRKATIVYGVLLFGLGTAAMGLGSQVWHFFALRLVSGVGLGMCLPPMLALVVESVPARRSGTAVAAIMLAMPIGLTLSGVIVPRLNAALGWNAVFLVCGAASLAVGAIALLTLREPPRSRGDQCPASKAAKPSSRLAEIAKSVSLARVAIYAVAILLVYVAMTFALSWLPATAELAGLPAISAGQAISFWSLAGMAGTVLAGVAVNRLGGLAAARIVLAGFALSVGLAAATLQAAGTAPTILYVAAALGGLFASGAITVLYAAASGIFPESIRASGMSIITLSGKSGGVVGAALGGVLLASASLAALFLAVAIMAGCAWLCLAFAPAERG